MNEATLIAILFASLTHGFLSSLHCSAMCGPIAVVSITANSSKLSKFLQYNLGRLVGYIIGGAMIGTLGALVDFSTINNASVYMAIFASIVYLGFLIFPVKSKFFGGKLSGLTSKLGKLSKGYSWLLGLISVLLPCAVLYPAFILALSSGSTVYAMLVMSTFWLGTLPIFVIVFSSFEFLKSNAFIFKYRKLALVILMIMTTTALVLRAGHQHGSHHKMHQSKHGAHSSL